MVRLGDICTFQSGGTPSKSEPSYFGGSTPWVTTVALKGNAIDANSAAEWITEKAINESAAKIVPAGSIMVGTRVGVGKAAVNAVPMSASQDIVSLLNINELAWDKTYVCKFILSRKEFLQSQARGATIKGIKIDILAELELPDISLIEQKAVVAVLYHIDNLISSRKQQLSKLDELIKSRFIEIFGDPVTNPMGLKTILLADIADLVSGITKGRKTKETQLREVPYMAVSNVKDGYIDWSILKTIAVSEAEIELYRLLPDDILITEGGDPDKVGRGAIIRQPLHDYIHQNHIFRVRLDESILLPDYFAEYLMHQKAKQYFLRCAKQTTGIASINMTQLKALPVIIPPMDLQSKFTTFVQQVNKLKPQIQKNLERLEMLKKALVQKYFE